MPPPDRPGLLVLVLAALGRNVPEPDRPQPFIKNMWAGLSKLGMNEPTFGAPVEAPDLPLTAVSGYQLLAARGRPPSEDFVSQAVLFARHDVLGIMAALASNRHEDGISQWEAYHAAWRASAAPVGDVPAGVLGETLIFFAHASDASEPLPAGLAPLVPSTVRALGEPCWDPWVRTTDGFVLWGAEEPARSRVVAALAPGDKADEFSAWAWWDPGRDRPDLAPFPAYLVHAAKLRYEQEVHARRRADQHERMDRVEAGLDTLLERQASQPEPGASDALMQAQADLVRERSQAGGLTQSVAMLEALEHTVQIARRNLDATAPDVDAASSARHLIERDRALALPLLEQIEHDVAYGRAIGERAQAALDLTALRFEHAREVLARAQTRATVLQTTVLAALLAGLGAIQTFGIRFSPDEPLKAPLLATLVAVLTAVPLLVAHWQERYDAVDRLVAAIAGAAVTWLGLVAVWRDAPWFPQALAAALGAVAGLVLTELHERSRRGR